MSIVKKAPPFAMHSNRNLPGFEALKAAYADCGGATEADDLALLLEEESKGDFVSVARRIVLRDIFSFEWESHFWVPMFQFHPHDMSVKQEVRRVVLELDAVLDNWALALWFTEPNTWLKNKRPVDMVDRQFSEVLHAARADRFVATG